MERSKRLSIDTFAEEVFVLIKGIVISTVMPVWWSNSLLHSTEVLAHLGISSNGPGEVSLGEEAVGWYPVVVWCWLEVPEMLEVASG